MNDNEPETLHPRYAVLFVCMGNICRSPAAEGVFRHQAAAAGLANRLRIDSAGTFGYHQGKPADRRMQAAAERRGYRLDSLARQVRSQDRDDFDLLVAMDDDNLRDLQWLAGGRAQLRLLGEFIDPQNANPPPVPDPYFGASDDFERVLDMLEAAGPGLLAYCREQGGF